VTDDQHRPADGARTAAPSPQPRGRPHGRAPADNRITIDDFLKVDLRVAKVLAAEKVPNSRKLMKLSIDVGTEQRHAGRGHRRGLRARAAGRQDRRASCST
jgi:hypothetical protein